MATPSMRPDPHHRRALRPGQVAELRIIDTEIGDPEVVYEAGGVIEAPNWTSDGKWLVFNADGRLWRISPDGRDGPHRIQTAPVENLNNDHCLSPDGKTTYLSANDGHLYAVGIEGGTPRRISNDHDPKLGFRYYLHGVSPDGSTLAYVGLQRSDAGHVTMQIYAIPSAGGPDTMLHDAECPVDGPEYSPDGKWIWFNSEAAATRSGHAQLYRMNADGSGVEQVTFDERVNWFPHLSPDGEKVAWLSYPPGTEGHPPDKQVELKLMRPDGSDQRVIDRFLGGQGTINVNSWAPDSRRLAYVAYPMSD